jgi:hypothetical protein
MRHGVWRLAPALVLAAALFLVWPSTAKAVQDETATIKTEANLRTRPDTTSTSTIKTVLPKGTTVGVVCWTEGEPTYGTDKFGSMWLFVSEMNRGGWVHSMLVSPVDVPPCAEGSIILFDNCDEARDAGAAPIHVGSPGYGLHLDRDRDGVACEVTDWND